MSRSEKFVTDEAQIVKGAITASDFEEAADYATISLPWTFDRLHLGPRKQNTINARLWHIAAGVMTQAVLERELERRGYDCEMDWSHYRLSDVFDFKINGKIYDVKAGWVFTSYDDQLDRDKFSLRLLMQYRDYQGPNWRTFFPFMVPLTQLDLQPKKSGFVFGMVVTKEDQRKMTPRKGDRGYWCAAPFDTAQTFLHKTLLIKEREAASKGFNVVIRWKKRQGTLFDSSDQPIKLTLFGEWAGEKNKETIEVAPKETVVVESEMSSLSSINVDHPSLLGGDVLTITVKNNFRKAVPHPTDPTVNLNDSNFVWQLAQDSFINLRPQEGALAFWIGHITTDEFAEKFQKYPAYFVPHPNNMAANTPGRATPRFKERLEALGRKRDKIIANGGRVPWPKFSSLVKGNSVKGGFMISAAGPAGRALGAACYHYPPYALSEGALYVLAQDLHDLSSL